MTPYTAKVRHINLSEFCSSNDFIIDLQFKIQVYC